MDIQLRRNDTVVQSDGDANRYLDTLGEDRPPAVGDQFVIGKSDVRVTQVDDGPGGGYVVVIDDNGRNSYYEDHDALPEFHASVDHQPDGPYELRSWIDGSVATTDLDETVPQAGDRREYDGTEYVVTGVRATESTEGEAFDVHLERPDKRPTID